MPLTEFQTAILSLLASNRSPDSHVAGGTAIHAAADSARYSQDIDVFHDSAEAVATSAQADAATLRANGFEIRWLEQLPSFFRATASREGLAVKLEWAFDSAWRYYPVVPDALMGWRLHDADLATNKALALAGRCETRDLVDVIDFSVRLLPLEAAVWAACGKDPGFSPLLLLDQMNRNSKVDPAVLHAITREPISPVALKEQWLAIHSRAMDRIQAFAHETPGCFYLDSASVIHWPGTPRDAIRHEPTLGGAWPRIAEAG